MAYCYYCGVYAGVGASKCPSCDRWLDGYESADELARLRRRRFEAQASARANHPTGTIGAGSGTQRAMSFYPYQINNGGKKACFLVRASTDSRARSRLLSYIEDTGLALMSQGRSAHRISAFRSAEARRALLICGAPASELPADRVVRRVADGIYLEQRG